MAEGLTLLDVLRRCGCADCRQEHEEAIAEIDRLRFKLAQVVIANAEVAKLNAEQAETIERLRATLQRAAFYITAKMETTPQALAMHDELREALRGADET